MGKPYYKAIGEGLHLGYRKGATVGKWVVRRYTGDQNYIVETIAVADDIEDADGTYVRLSGKRRTARGSVEGS